MRSGSSASSYTSSGGRLLGFRLNRLPETLEEDEVALDVLRGSPFGGGSHDDAATLGIQVLHDLLEPRALLVVQPA
jgi:hypothetical protein